MKSGIEEPRAAVVTAGRNGGGRDRAKEGWEEVYTVEGGKEEARMWQEAVAKQGFYRIGVGFNRIATGCYRINVAGNRLLPHITASYRIKFFSRGQTQPIFCQGNGWQRNGVEEPKWGKA